MTTFETPGRVLLRVSLGSGDIRIDAGPGASTDVELVALRNDEATHTAIAGATVEARERGDRTEIVVELQRKGGWGFLGRGPSVGVRVHCPDGTDVEVSAESADVTATGHLGDVEAKTASGDLAFDVVRGLRVTTASGDVTAREVAAEGNVKTASGDVSVLLARSALSLNLVSGDAMVGEAKGPLAIATVSGDQAIESVESGEIKLNSVSGDVRVGVKAGLLLSIVAASVSGSMTSELPMEDTLLPEREPQLHVRARTVSGDVRIVRATAVAVA